MGRLDVNNLKILKEVYNAPIFFETGTAYGEGVKHALTFDFKRIISIEIMEPQFKILQEMFKNVSNLELICDSSTNAIKRLLPTISENIIFWLDAHYPNADLIQNNIGAKIQAYMDGDDNIRLPLDIELNLIKELRPNNKDVILIDDLNIYNNNISPEAYWLKPKKDFKQLFYVEIFKDTHHFVPLSNVQGMLLPND